ALFIPMTLFIYTHKPSDHEHVSESPTRQHYEIENNTIQPAIIAENLLAMPEAYKPKREVVEQAPPPIVYDVIATHYTAYCDGCIGITKNGADVRNTIY